MDRLIYAFFLAIVLLSVWGPIPNLYGLVIIISLFLIRSFFRSEFIFIAPAITAPFIFLFRAEDFNNFLVAGMTEILMIIAIIYYYLSFLNSYKIKRKIIFSTPLFLILLHLLYTILNSFLYIDNLVLFLFFLRIYILPLIFLIVIVNVAKKNPQLMITSFNYFILGVFIVVSISLLQYFSFIKIPSDNAVLGKFISGVVGELNLYSDVKIQFRTLFGFTIPRLNMLLGGSVGSVASILFGLGLSLICIKNISFKSKLLKILIGVTLIFAAILSVSVSIIASILIFLLWFLVHKKYKLTTTLTFIILPVILVLASSSVLILGSGDSPLEYFNLIYGDAIVDSDWIFGKGPVIFSTGYQLIPENYKIDVGIFRIMQESGFINMAIILMFIYLVISRAVRRIKNENSKQTLLFLIVFTLCLSSVHTNYIIVQPFSILVAISAAWIFSENNYNHNLN